MPRVHCCPEVDLPHRWPLHAMRGRVARFADVRAGAISAQHVGGGCPSLGRSRPGSGLLRLRCSDVACGSLDHGACRTAFRAAQIGTSWLLRDSIDARTYRPRRRRGASYSTVLKVPLKQPGPEFIALTGRWLFVNPDYTHCARSHLLNNPSVRRLDEPDQSLHILAAIRL